MGGSVILSSPPVSLSAILPCTARLACAGLRWHTVSCWPVQRPVCIMSLLHSVQCPDSHPVPCRAPTPSPWLLLNPAIAALTSTFAVLALSIDRNSAQYMERVHKLNSYLVRNLHARLLPVVLSAAPHVMHILPPYVRQRCFALVARTVCMVEPCAVHPGLVDSFSFMHTERFSPPLQPCCAHVNERAVYLFLLVLSLALLVRCIAKSPPCCDTRSCPTLSASTTVPSSMRSGF